MESVPLHEGENKDLEPEERPRPIMMNPINTSKDFNYDDGDDEEEEEDYEITLKAPAGLLNRIIHMFEFPILLLLYVIPNYKKSPTVKKLVFCMVFNLAILTGAIFLINRWIHVTAKGMNMTNESMGFTFSAIGFSYPFFKYNLKIASNDKDVDFMQSFLQLGIFKLGICVGISWLFACIITLNSNLNRSLVPQGFAITICVYFGLLLLLSVVIVLNRFRLSSKISIFYLSLFSIFYAIAIPILEEAEP